MRKRNRRAAYRPLETYPSYPCAPQPFRPCRRSVENIRVYLRKQPDCALVSVEGLSCDAAVLLKLRYRLGMLEAERYIRDEVKRRRTLGVHVSDQRDIVIRRDLA